MSEFSPSTVFWAVTSGAWCWWGAGLCMLRKVNFQFESVSLRLFLKGEQWLEGLGRCLVARTSDFRKVIHLIAPNWYLWADHLLLSLALNTHSDSWGLWWALAVIIHRPSEAPSESVRPVLGRMWDFFLSLQKTTLDWSFCLWEGNHLQEGLLNSWAILKREKTPESSYQKLLLSQWVWAGNVR